MLLCPNCNDERGGKFCAECGAKLVENPNARYCRACDAEIDPCDKFCFWCGWDQMRILPEPGFFRRLWERIGFSILH